MLSIVAYTSPPLIHFSSPNKCSVLLYVRPLFIRSCATEDVFGVKLLSRAPSRAKRFIVCISPFSCSSQADPSFGRDENYPAPADVKVFDVLLENNAVVHPWPTPDFPDGLSGIDMTKTICEDYVYAYKFPESTNGDGLDALSVCPAVFMFALSHCG